MLISMFELSFLGCYQCFLCKFISNLQIFKKVQLFLLKNTLTNTSIENFYFVKAHMAMKVFHNKKKREFNLFGFINISNKFSYYNFWKLFMLLIVNKSETIFSYFITSNFILPIYSHVKYGRQVNFNIKNLIKIFLYL